MKKLFLSLFAVIGVLVVTGWILVSTMRVSRPPAPPAGSPITYPWGSMHLDDDHDEPDSDLEESIVASIRSEPPGLFDPDRDGRNEYAILVLSGWVDPTEDPPRVAGVGEETEWSRPH